MQHMIRAKPTRNEPHYAAIISVTLGLGVFALVTLLRAAGLWQPAELLAYDLFLALRPMPHGASPYVTVIQVTEDDIATLGRWPVPDAELGRALATLGALEPSAIGLDIYRDVEVPPGRSELDAILRGDERIVAVTKLADAQGRGVPAPPALAGSDRVGFNDVLVDSDGIVRRGLLFMDDGPDTVSAFALKLAAKHLAAQGVALAGDPLDADHIRLGPTTVRPLSANFGSYVGVDAAGYQFPIDYAQPHFDTFTFGDLLAGQVPPGAIRGRIVLLGVAAASVKDDFYAPLGRWLRQGDAKMSGIELHARIADQLLRFALQAQPPITSFGTAAEHLWILLWALTGAGAGLMGRSARRLALLWVLGAVAVAAASYAMFCVHVWTPVVPAWLAWLGASGLVTAYLAQAERRQRQVLHDLFATHVSADVANLLWERRAELVEHGSLKPQGLTATTLFLDLRGFTAISERLVPDELMRWLNRALEAFTRTILDHEGMIDDYFGDGIKANFGVFSRPGAEATLDGARQAVECARALAHATRDLNARARAGDSPYAIRIGIHTGFVIAGTVGSARRSKFTTIGDAVNLAARLEALDDPRLDATSACQIIVSETTRGHLGPEVATRAVAAVLLKGKRAPITVHQVLLEDIASPQPEALEALQS